MDALIRAWPRVLVLALAAGAVPSARAGDLAPGQWEIALEVRVAGQPGFAPAPFRLSQCLTAADASDPSRILGPLSNPGASDCAYSDTRYSGDTFAFSMRCAGAYAVQSRGQIRYSQDSMDGDITATANIGGSVVEFQNKVTAHRIGGC